MLYFKDWCNLIFEKDKVLINLNCSVEDIERIKKSTFQQIKFQTTLAASSVLGSNPVLCLSGGIDSQAMIQIWQKEFNHNIIIFKFANNLNVNEVDDAITYAKKYKLNYSIIELDVLRFLTCNLLDYGKRYRISSPQFAVHIYFIEKLKALGYTGAAFGGNGLVYHKNSFKFFQTSAQLLDLEKFSDSISFPVIPSFLSFTREICMKLALASQSIIQPVTEERYRDKIETYKSLGIPIIPQDTKKTGFEQLKLFWNTHHSDPTAFEIHFRIPLYVINPNLETDTIISNSVVDYILKNK